MDEQKKFFILSFQRTERDGSLIRISSSNETEVAVGCFASSLAEAIEKLEMETEFKDSHINKNRRFPVSVNSAGLVPKWYKPKTSEDARVDCWKQWTENTHSWKVQEVPFLE